MPVKNTLPSARVPRSERPAPSRIPAARSTVLRNDPPHASAANADAELLNRIRIYIAGRGIPSFAKLQLNVRGGIVTIRGVVQTPYEKQLLLQTARRVSGVLDVDSSGLVTSATSDTPATASTSGASHRVQKLKIALAFTVLAGLLVAFVVTRSGASVVPWKAKQYVTGQVLVNGQPAPGAYVTLFPAGAAGDGRGIVSITGLDGQFRIPAERLSTDNAHYVVTVRWFERLAEGNGRPGRSLITAEYTDPATSPLRVRITHERQVLEPFEIPM